jgi:hypothetical protein
MAWLRKCQMSLLDRVVLFLCVVIWSAVSPHDARAQSFVNPAQVHISYDAPADAKFRPVYEALKRRNVLERLQGFLSPLRLPKELSVRLTQCGADTSPYVPSGPVTICYEMVQRISDITFQNTTDPNDQTLVMDGTFVQLVLHEVALAVFDVLQVPIWGRAEDAADRVSALIMMQFGDELAVTTIIGTAKFFEYSKHEWTGGDFASQGSPESQRFYNYLCIAYGGDPLTFRFLTPRPGPSAFATLPEHRAARCAGEYQQVRHAFDMRIMPFVDPDAVTKVRASQWLLSDEYPGRSK